MRLHLEVAYLCRNMRQPRSEVMRMTVRTFRRMLLATSREVSLENGD